MKDEEGRWSCDQCGRRCRDGGLQVVERGTIEARRANRQEDAFYCGERCLRNRLMNVRPDEDPEEALQRQLDQANLRKREADDRTLRAEGDLSTVEGIIAELQKLLPALPDTDAGQQIKRSLINAHRIITDRWGRGY